MKITVGGTEVEVESVNFTPVSEPWCLYRLDDGTTVRLKLVVSDVYRLPQPDPITGAPQVLVKSSNIMSVEPPPSATPKGEVH